VAQSPEVCLTAAIPDMPTLDPGSVLSQSRGENFPVVSPFLPRRTRRHLLSIYGVARLIDDVGDEAAGDRGVQLDWLEADLERAGAGTALHPLVRRLAPTLEQLDLSLQPFRDLIEANRTDQVVTRYETFDDLIAYCRLSAVPVGRLVLALFGADSPERRGAADQVCIGLQVTEHLQDVLEDAVAGRIYLPARDRAACGVSEADLRADHATPPLRRLVALESARARRLLAPGAGLARSLPWPQRAAVAGFVAGGLAALDAIQGAGYDVLGVRCRPDPVRRAVRMASVGLAPRPDRMAA
jgi:squalene synthase HpnC